MRVGRLKLHDFRNFSEWELEPHERLTVIYGPNAAGKTNAIEALQLSTTGVSFRSPRWGEVVRWGAEEASVTVEAAGDGRNVAIALAVSQDGGRSYRVNGVARRRVADVTGLVPAIVFTPEDIAAVKGPAEGRRALVDALGEQLSRTYRALLQEYGRIVRQRNAVLKEEPTPEAVLASLDAQLVESGSRLASHRVRLVRRVGVRAVEAYSDISCGEKMSVRYESSEGLSDEELGAQPSAETIAESMERELAARSTEERSRRVTLVGPHRDDVLLLLEGRPARAYGSQGQARTIALSWKLAEVGVVREIVGARPLLLLDDVMSELDEQRREALTGAASRDVQTIVTTTNLGYFSEETLGGAKVVRIGP